MTKSIKLETASYRAGLIVAIFICLITTAFFVKWCFANAIASRAPSTEVAELAISMAPNDPQTHYALGVLNEKSFLPEDLPKSLAEFEQSVALAPNDYRLWLAFGKARERNGDAAGAELALRKALALAPNYAQVQWTLGNVLLRRGKTEEAFDEIRGAGENDADYRLPAITTAWQFANGDFAVMKQFIGNSANLNSALAVFLAERNRLDEAVEIWNALPDEDKKTIYKPNGEQLFGALLAAKKYRRALQIQNSFLEQIEAEKFAVGKIYNGGFEADLAREKAGVFDWQIADSAQPQIGPSVEQKHGGERSLLIIFNSSTGKDFRQISQTVVVEPAKKYHFDGFYKSNLKTIATLRWEIVDAADGKILATTNPISADADWSDIKMDFITSENTEAVTVRLAREPCKSVICPISGKVWFDDFSIGQ